MKIGLDESGVKAIREFADAMPVAINSIVDDTQMLNDFYNSISDQIGVHEEQFAEMMQILTSAQTEASDAIQALVPQLKRTADQMEEFIRKRREIAGK